MTPELIKQWALEAGAEFDQHWGLAYRVGTATFERFAAKVAAHEREMCDKDAERYRWLCSNNFDRQGVTQIETWIQTWEPHSKTGEPTEWTQRIRGGALDAAIDAAMKEQP
jgi:hypothetical protein